MVSKADRVVLIGVGGDSGCGKSTFLRRLKDLFSKELVTVICLDDYHSLDRKQRKETGITALDPRANNFDLMAEQAAALKSGQSIQKPIYNHETGKIDPPERIDPTPIVILEGLHPFYDKRVRDLLDFKVYFDLSDPIKIQWKIQRDMAERGHSYDDVIRAIESRRPDFSAYIDPQKQHADVVLQILPSELPEKKDGTKKIKAAMVQVEGIPNYDPPYLFDRAISDVCWKPNFPNSDPELTFCYGTTDYFGRPASYLSIDGEFAPDDSPELEQKLRNTSETRFGELASLILKHTDYPGSRDGTGFFQVLIGLKFRSIYEALIAQSLAAAKV
ncbi:phosphoribulokinase [Gloeobacter kilaueensis]|uniref:phosphoribulokinase n=1 Tax=Gloeobacter kilaueensis (strain ATCC BAA-2537 / CCAP 1431/1 / ULC 316 / JS1) TaxID=1183438 RepID=U5QBM9_GLOK1|nr:phosphoribulokinase [Gloeobacter kilaueensis]AGY56261.1 phosphoribulokinase [Gloeobacter kilaueensis JS1]